MHADSIKKKFYFMSPFRNYKGCPHLQNGKKFLLEAELFNWKQNLGTPCTDSAFVVFSNTSCFPVLMKKEVPHAIMAHGFVQLAYTVLV
jgi:hypothetical protein